MLALILYFNYFYLPGHQLTLKPGNWPGHFLLSYFTYFIPFGLAYLLQWFFYEQCAFFRNKWFLLMLFLAPAIFALRVNLNLFDPLIKQYWNGNEQKFWIHCSKWFSGLFTGLIPVYITWKIKDSKTMPFYGSRRLHQSRPYLLMILFMIPLIALAATQADFLKMYPRAKVVAGWQLHPESLYYFLHEFFYSLDFITIEVFFRGFLVIALVKHCGKQCIVPAAAFYCCIHLGKPMGEAISSFPGGLLLGIISYHTNSIRGGLTVHLGIAWLMEITGYIASQV